MSSQNDTARPTAPIPEVDQQAVSYGLFTRLRRGRLAAAREQLEFERAELQFQQERDAYAAQSAQRPAKGPESAADAPNEQGVRWTFWRGLSLAVLVPGTLAFGLFMALVVIGLQVGFWTGFLPESLQRIDLKLLNDLTLDMPQFIPIAIEGGAWIFTALAVVMVLFGRDPRRYVQYMWLLSTFAAVINTSHNSTIGQPPGENDWWTGGFTGALSLLGPFIVHSLVVAITEIVKGTTIGKSLLAGVVGTASPMQLVLNAVFGVLLWVLDLIVHPVISVRAIGIWRGVSHFSYRDAWKYAARPYYVGLHKTYRDRIQKKSDADTNNGVTVWNAERDERDEHRDGVVPPPRPDSTLPPPDGLRHGGVITAERDGRDERDVERDDLDALARRDLENDIEQMASVTDLQLREVFQLDGTFQDEQSGNAKRAERDGERDKKRDSSLNSRDTVNGEVPGSGESAAETTSERRASDIVVYHWWKLKNAGTDPSRLNKADVARELKVSRSLVSKVFKACAKGEHPDITKV
ncbi:hypothetical protein [Lentzea sp. NBRC 102530]|uniref:hypothetical protein n=1 Tax=Lentzea sp. NBRC 102530 TaxID=3032201 RepID=UPI0024A51E05|nr:hypothetical protein [Lentzea sp. NBRC 102530]GLY54829.1 hypothetical protein Lesp01_84840 [Lentzea sp. NBRC 102530]